MCVATPNGSTTTTASSPAKVPVRICPPAQAAGPQHDERVDDQREPGDARAAAEPAVIADSQRVVDSSPSRLWCWPQHDREQAEQPGRVTAEQHQPRLAPSGAQMRRPRREGGQHQPAENRPGAHRCFPGHLLTTPSPFPRELAVGRIEAAAYGQDTKSTLIRGELLWLNKVMITYDAADQIATITLKRPERLNALTFTMRGESPEAAALACRPARCSLWCLTCTKPPF